jgi:hypothetical protein
MTTTPPSQMAALLAREQDQPADRMSIENARGRYLASPISWFRLERRADQYSAHWSVLME